MLAIRDERPTSKLFHFPQKRPRLEAPAAPRLLPPLPQTVVEDLKRNLSSLQGLHLRLRYALRDLEDLERA